MTPQIPIAIIASNNGIYFSKDGGKLTLPIIHLENCIFHWSAGWNATYHVSFTTKERLDRTFSNLVNVPMSTAARWIRNSCDETLIQTLRAFKTIVPHLFDLDIPIEPVSASAFEDLCNTARYYVTGQIDWETEYPDHD